MESALLIVLGEPISEDQSAAIIQRVIEGLTAWNAKNGSVDLNAELLGFGNKKAEAEQLETGGFVIKSSDYRLYIELLIYPAVQTLHTSLIHFLTNAATYKHVVHAGPLFLITGSWILRDGTFSMHDFARILHRADVVTALTEAIPNSTITVSCFPEGEWTDQGAKHHGLDEYAQLTIGALSGNTAIKPQTSQLLQAYLDRYVRFTPLQTLMPTSDMIGSIRFRRPTLYVFPAGQGSAALFGIDGFLMLIDGGFERKTCFWDFMRHVDHLDALLISGVTTGNLFGTMSLLDTLASTKCAPKIGHAFVTIPEVGKTQSIPESKNPLLVSLYDEGAYIFDRMGRLGLKPQTCAYVPPPVTAKHPEAISLYEKVGQGRLEMYVLNPIKESKEYAEFVETWKKRAPKVFGSRFSTKPGSDASDYYPPLINRSSMAVLLVWRPWDPDERIIRVLYSGSCPQEKIMAGTEKLRSLEFLKYPYVTTAILEKKPTSLTQIRAALLTKKPSMGKTAAELLAEAAKLGNNATKAALAAVLLPVTQNSSRMASPPSPPQAQSPPPDSDVEGAPITENGSGGGKDEASAESDSTPAEAHREHRPGFAIDAEPEVACEYEDATEQIQGVGCGILEYVTGPEGISPILDPRLRRSSLNPNAQPFYPRWGRCSADSSPERRERTPTRQESTGSKDFEIERPELQESDWHPRTIDDVRSAWGEPLGLPTLPSKKEATSGGSGKASDASSKQASKPVRAPSATKSAVKPSSKAANPESASKGGAAAATVVNSTAYSPSPKSSPTTTMPAKPLTKPTSLPAKPAAPKATLGKPKTALKRSMSGIIPTPCYVDLAYVPHQANPYYCTIDFFKYIRAKYYVFSTPNPPKETFDAFLAGKRSWMDQDESVTIIPTYDSDTLSLWMSLRKDELAFENVDVSPACVRCSVNLEEHAEATCAAYRLEL